MRNKEEMEGPGEEGFKHYMAAAVKVYKEAGNAWSDPAKDALTDLMVSQYSEDLPEREAVFSALRSAVEEEARK